MQIEQCLVANGLGAGIAQEDLIGLETGDLKFAAEELGKAADKAGYPISEYILDRGLQRQAGHAEHRTAGVVDVVNAGGQ